MNVHNAVYYSETNPHLVIEDGNLSPGFCVWGAVRSTGLLGPYFFDDTVTGEKYLHMLKSFAIPQVDPENDVWMQDGAPPHYSNVVREYLNQTFNTWIGRRGTIDWPPRSPDLTPCDYSVWGIMKDNVYSHPINSKSDLRQRITEEFERLNSDERLCQAIMYSVRRCEKCIEAEGQHFEHLL